MSKQQPGGEPKLNLSFKIKTGDIKATVPRQRKRQKHSGKKTGAATGESPLVRRDSPAQPTTDTTKVGGDDGDDSTDESYTQETVDDCEESTDDESGDESEEDAGSDVVAAAVKDENLVIGDISEDVRRLSGELVSNMHDALGFDKFVAWAPSGQGDELPTAYVVSGKHGTPVLGPTPLPKKNVIYYEVTCTETNDTYRAVGVKSTTGTTMVYHVVLNDKLVHKHLMPEGDKSRVTFKKYLAQKNPKTAKEKAMYAPEGSIIYSSKLAAAVLKPKVSVGDSASGSHGGRQKRKRTVEGAANAAPPIMPARNAPNDQADAAVSQRTTTTTAKIERCALAPTPATQPACSEDVPVDPATETAVRLPVAGGHITLRFSFQPFCHD